MDRIDYNDPVFVQPKLDGVRCLFTKNGAYTRRGNKFMNVAHLEAQLFDFFKVYPNAVLDGELYNHSLKNDFEKIISLVRKTVDISPEDRIEASQMVQYHIYDVIQDENPNASYKLRKDFLELNDLLRQANVVMTPTFEVEKERDVIALKEQFIAQGYEGAMIRTNGAYENKRSYNLIKVKDFIDFEAEVIGYVEGKGKLEGKLGKFLMKLENGKEFGAPASGFNFERRREIWESRERYMGTSWTVEAFEFTKNGAPRFPVLKEMRNYE